jgi:hypothetical protein
VIVPLTAPSDSRDLELKNARGQRFQFPLWIVRNLARTTGISTYIYSRDFTRLEQVQRNLGSTHRCDWMLSTLVLSALSGFSAEVASTHCVSMGGEGQRLYILLSSTECRNSRVERTNTEQRRHSICRGHGSSSRSRALFECQSGSKQHKTRRLGKGELTEEATTRTGGSSSGTRCMSGVFIVPIPYAICR